jgi:hypothetical protein
MLPDFNGALLHALEERYRLAHGPSAERASEG